MIEVVCRNRHPASVMRRHPAMDAFECLECGNVNTSRFLYLRWGAILRLARRR